MKRICCLLLVLGLATIMGCAQEKPEAAAQKIFERQVQAAAHEGLQMDVSGLEYEMVEEGEGRAVVEVTGLMPVKATIPLVQQKGKWVLEKPVEPAPTKETAAAH